MSRSARRIAMACMCCAIPVAAAAQPDVRANEWSRGTTLSGLIGVTADSSQSGPALGGGMGWEVTPNIALEGGGSWAEFGHGTNSFAGALKVRLRIAGRRHVDPFVQAGVGLYRVTFGTDDRDVPNFYRRRIAAAMPGHGDRTFTDPTVVGGGGVSIFVSRHFAVRPDVAAAFVLREGRTHIVTSAAVHGVYHFESHPVTPVRAVSRNLPRLFGRKESR